MLLRRWRCGWEVRWRRNERIWSRAIGTRSTQTLHQTGDWWRRRDEIDRIQTLDSDRTQSRQTQEQFGESTWFVWVILLTVLLQTTVHLLAIRFDHSGTSEAGCIWIIEDDRSETSQLRPVHVHLSHFVRQFVDYAIEYENDSRRFGCGSIQRLTCSWTQN